MKSQYPKFSRYALPGALALLAGVLLTGSTAARSDTSDPELAARLSKSVVVTSSDARPGVHHEAREVRGEAQEARPANFYGVWHK